MKILEILTEKRKIGNAGERAAVRHLKRHGYRIIAKNYVAAGAEIDIIARSCDTVVFVEVKTRTVGKTSPNEPRPASSVTSKKQRKIISAAKYFMGTHKKGYRMRFDVIEVLLDGKKKVQKISHLVSAFNYNTAHPM